MSQEGVGIEPISLSVYTYSPVAVHKSYISVVHVSRTNAEEEPIDSTCQRAPPLSASVVFPFSFVDFTLS